MNLPRSIRIAGLGALLCHIVAAQEITVAAAADLQPVMQEVAARFQKETGKSVKVIYVSAVNFFQQIQNGAPFDVFLSANLDYPKKLEASGLTVPGTFYQYARGKIVVWVPKDSKIDVSPGLKAVLDPRVQKIAVANPLHAPYGQAAVAAMQKGGIYEKVKDRLVLGENISQTTSFVTSGAADIGIIALSLAMSPNMKGKGRYSEIPPTEYPPIAQACVILSSSKNQELSQEFLSYVQGATVSDLLASYGFDVSNRPRK